jgi:hypothetical protein
MQRTDPVEKKSISLPMVSGTSMDTELDTRSYDGSVKSQTNLQGTRPATAGSHAPGPQRCPIAVPRVSPVPRAC